MRRRLLIITKDPEFDMRGEVVLGQCEPFTSGWSLILIDTVGRREVLSVGTYTDLRKMQESCSSLEETPDIRKRINDVRVLLMSSVTETLAVRYGDLSSESRVAETRPLEPVEPQQIPDQTPGGLLSLHPNGRVVIATLIQPERADDADFLKHELLTLMDWQPRAVLVDLSQVATLSQDACRELAETRDRLREVGSDFALCNLSRGVQQKLRTLRQSEALSVFESQASALAAFKS